MDNFCPVHTAPEKFENGVFTLKAHQMFSMHTAPVKLKKRNNCRSDFGLTFFV